MPARIYILLCLFMLPLQSAFPAETERRIALVIGNADYVYAPLANPARDAADMSSALRDLGFDVTTLLNADLRQMRRAAIEFGRALDDGGIGLFYYAGHGIQVGGQNYLIPLGAAIDYEEHVEVEALSVQQILSRMGGARNRMNIVILDACRNNPLKRSMRSAQNGLAQMDAPTGTYIAYATAPGQTAADGSGRNGLYTGALLKGIQKRGLQIETVFKDVRRDVIAKTDGAQVPWSASSITGDFVFNPEAETVDLEFEDSAPKESRDSAGLRVAPTSGALDLEREKAFWEAISTSNRAEDYNAYLDEYPNGVYKRLARSRLESIEQAPVEKPVKEPLKEPAKPLKPQPEPLPQQAAVEKDIIITDPPPPPQPASKEDNERFSTLAAKPGKSRMVGFVYEVAGDTKNTIPMKGHIGPEWGYVRGKNLSFRITRKPDGRLHYYSATGKGKEAVEGHLIRDGDVYRGKDSLLFFLIRYNINMEFWLEE